MRMLLLGAALAGTMLHSRVQGQEFEPLLGWPDLNGQVRAMVLDDNTGVLYIGGTFTTVDGIPRARLAALDGQTGAVLPFQADADSTVHALALRQGVLYVGGDMQVLGDSSRSRLAAVDASSGAVLAWAPSLNNTVRSILAGTDVVHVGGWFDQANGTPRSRLAAFSAADGSLLPWAPVANGPVLAMVAHGDSIIVGGSFTTINGSVRGRLARLDAVNGAPSPWAPEANGGVFALALPNDSTLVAGGAFTSLGGEARTALSGIDMVSGVPVGLAPSITGSVLSLALTEHYVMAGGFMTSVEGTPNRHFASFDRVTMEFTSGSPTPSSTVFAMAASADRLYMGGAFTEMDGVARARIAAFGHCRPLSWYADADEDGFGDPGVVWQACEQPPGFVPDASDCNDDDPWVGPGITWFLDADGDGYGDPQVTVVSCDGPVGYVDEGLDCDDADPLNTPFEACDDGDPFTALDATQGYPDCGCSGVQLLLSVKVMLEGPYDPMSGLMNDDLRLAGLIPLTEPYTALGVDISTSPHQGGEVVDPAVLAVSGPDAIVDWVWLEIRAQNDRSVLQAARFALVQRDGDVVDVDGVSPVRFALPFGFYYVAVAHRNHMGVVEGAPAYLEVSARDFSAAGLITAYADDRRAVGNVLLLRQGDANFDRSVKYTGNANDRDLVLQHIGGVVPTSVVTGYRNEDLNMDGVIKYTGEANDRDLILQTIGGVIPTLVRTNTFDR